MAFSAGCSHSPSAHLSTLADTSKFSRTRLQFIWEFIDAKKQYKRIITTPLGFAKHHTGGYDPSAAIALINDPRNPFERLYTVERLGNVVGGRPVRYINLEVQELKDIAVELIKDDIPVWFGCDVEKASNTFEGVMDEKLCASPFRFLGAGLPPGLAQLTSFGLFRQLQ